MRALQGPEKALRAAQEKLVADCGEAGPAAWRSELHQSLEAGRVLVIVET